MINKKITFAVEDIHLIDNEIDKSQFSKLLVDCFSTAVSAHDTIVSEDVLKKMASSILLKPFVFVVDKRFDDLGGHDKNEVPGGFVPHDSPIMFKTMPDGSTMFSVEVLIWKRYSGKLLEYFKRDGNKKSVSVEIEIFDAIEDPKTGLTELLDFVFNAITCLGDVIRPAIKDAKAILEFSEEFEKDKDEYLFSSKYHGIDFKIPDYMKQNAKKALDSYRDGTGNANSVSLAIGRYIVKNDSMTPERMRQVHKTLNKNGQDEMTINLHGGNESRQWSSDIINKMDEIDSKEMLYLQEGEGETNKEDDIVFLEGDNKMADENKNIDEMEEEKNMAKEDTEDMAAKPKEGSPEEEKKESPAEEKKESPAEEKKEVADKKEMEDKKEMADSQVAMSLDANLDMSALLELLKNETQVYKELTDESDKAINYAINACIGEIAKGKDANIKVVTDSMLSYMTKVAKKAETLATKNSLVSQENKSLREFRQDIETKQKNYEVDTVLKEAFDAGMPDEELEKCREESLNFSLAEIDAFKNMVRAKAFRFFGKKNTNKSVTRLGLPFTEQKFKKPTLWK